MKMVPTSLLAQLFIIRKPCSLIEIPDITVRPQEMVDFNIADVLAS